MDTVTTDCKTARHFFTQTALLKRVSTHKLTFKSISTPVHSELWEWNLALHMTGVRVFVCTEFYASGPWWTERPLARKQLYTFWS